MLIVTVKLISARSPDRDALLGEAMIENLGSGTPALGNYRVRLSKRGGFKKSGVYKDVILRRYRRKRYGAWYLLAIGLIKALGEKLEDAIDE